MLKICTKCKIPKSIANFWKNKTNKDGLHLWCKDCLRAANIARLNGPKRDVELRQRANRHLQNKYGISIDEYEELSAKQDDKCLICNNEELGIKLAVDHDHKTGEIRGLLCHNCNRGLGMFKDNTDLLYKAIKYLETVGGNA